jgi:hypothetical protein
MGSRGRRLRVSLHKRLERLEAVTGELRYETPLWLDLFMKQMDNIEREGRGEEFVPLTPEEAELKREQRRAFLEHYIPKVRRREMRPEVLDIVDQLEEHVVDKLSEGEANG